MRDPVALQEQAHRQAGVVTRAQALSAGLTRAAVTALLRSGRRQRIFAGVYATFSGPLPRRSLLWAAVLKAGEGAVLSHTTAAELVGLADRPEPAIHVSVPTTRTPARIPGVVVHRSRRLVSMRHPTRLPPQTRVDETVVDLTQSARAPEEAIGWLARALGSRLTTPQRLDRAFSDRPRLRWRRLLTAALHDVALGCHSYLELAYLRDVERAHDLPRGQRQVKDPDAARYHDVDYRPYATRVELDGRAAHPDHDRWRDMRRDNAGAEHGVTVLRYGVSDVQCRPCQVAAQLVRVLRRHGWTGAPRRCRRGGCALP